MKRWRIGFWNVAGLTNKEEEFWKGIGEWEVIVLLETWLEKKGWSKVRNRVPKGYKWRTQWASRNNRKGRAMGGMMIGVREEMIGWQERGQGGGEKGIMVERVKGGEQEWTVVAVYVNGDMERKWESIRGWMEGQG